MTMNEVVADRGIRLTLSDLMLALEIETSVSPAALISTSRHKGTVRARRLMAAVLRNGFNLSFPEVAASMGRPTHSVIHTWMREWNQKQEATFNGLTLPPKSWERRIIKQVNRVADIRVQNTTQFEGATASEYAELFRACMVELQSMKAKINEANLRLIDNGLDTVSLQE